MTPSMKVAGTDQGLNWRLSALVCFDHRSITAKRVGSFYGMNFVRSLRRLH